MIDLFTAAMNKDMVWEMSNFHFHDPYEILFVTGGTCTFLIETEMVQAVRGTILLIRGGLLHMSTSLPDSEYLRYVITFYPAKLDGLSTANTDLMVSFHKERHVIQLPEGEIDAMEKLFKACFDRSETYGADVRRNLSFLNLLIRLGELQQDEYSHELKPEIINSKNYLRVKPIVSYIMENPADDLSLEYVSEKFFYNKHYLCRIFKTATGISVGKYITAVRIQYASTYLRQGYSVQESGERAGFKNNSNFISTFRKIMGIPPGQYRQKFRNQGATWNIAPAED